MLRRRSLLLSVAAVLAIVSTASAHEGRNRTELLKGDYAFSGSATCLVSRGGFNANLTPVPAPAPFPFIVSFTVQGVRTFNGDGTGQVAARVVSIAHPYALPVSQVNPQPVFNRGGASASELTGTFTYHVASDLSVTVENISLTGHTITGAGAGNTFTNTNFPTFVGQLSTDRRTLTLAHEDAVVETQTFFANNVEVDSQDRVCHRSRIFLEQKADRR